MANFHVWPLLKFSRTHFPDNPRLALKGMWRLSFFKVGLPEKKDVRDDANSLLVGVAAYRAGQLRTCSAFLGVSFEHSITFYYEINNSGNELKYIRASGDILKISYNESNLTINDAYIFPEQFGLSLRSGLGWLISMTQTELPNWYNKLDKIVTFYSI